MSQKSKMLSAWSSNFDPNTSGGYRAHVSLRSSLHVLVYQLCILYILFGTISIGVIYHTQIWLIR